MYECLNIFKSICNCIDIILFGLHILKARRHVKWDKAPQNPQAVKAVSLQKENLKEYD